jgi:predicted transcriptional regulator
MKQSTIVNLKVSAEFRRWLDKLAKKLRRNRSSLIELALAELGERNGSPPPDRVTAQPELD